MKRKITIPLIFVYPYEKCSFIRYLKECYILHFGKQWGRQYPTVKDPCLSRT
jgi:hypothetical protein